MRRMKLGAWAVDPGLLSRIWVLRWAIAQMVLRLDYRA